MSKSFRIILFAFGLIAVLYAATVGVMSTAWFHQILVRRVTASLENLTGAQVEIGDLNFRPAILEIAFRRLVLHGKESSGEPPLLSAQTAVLRFNPVSVFGHRLALRSLDWQDAEVHIYTYPDGSTNLAGPQLSRGGGQFINDLLDLAVRRLTISRTNVFWNNQQLPLALSARDVAILLRFGPGSRYVGSVSSSQTRLTNSRWSLPPITFSSRLDFSRDDVAVTSLTWRCCGITGQGSFSLHRLPSLEGKLSLQAQGEISALAQALRIPELKSGNIIWDGQAAYRGGNFQAKGQVKARQLMVRSLSLKPGSINFSADFLADRNHIEISNLLASLLGGAAQGRAEISWGGSSPKFVLHTQLRELDLTDALDLIPTGQEFLRNFRVAASMDGIANASWNGWLKQFTSEFNLRFDPRAGGQTGSWPIVGFARGTATIAEGLQVNLQDSQFQMPHSFLAAQGTLGVAQSNLVLSLTTTDFEDWRPLVEAWSEPSEPIPLVLKSSATFSGAVVGSISQPEIRGRLKVGTFHYRGWRWDSFEGIVVAAPALIQVSSGKLLSENSAFIFDVSLGLEQGKFTPHAPVHITAQAERTPLEGLRDALNIPYPFSGFATGRFEADGTRTSLAGTGNLRVERGAIANEPFDSLSAKIRVTGSVWNFQDLQVVKGRGRITGQARVDPSQRVFSTELNGVNLSLAEFKRPARHALPATASSPEAHPEPVKESLEGRINFDLRGKGTLENPQLQSNFEFRNITSNGSPIGTLRGRVEWGGQQMGLQGDFQGPTGTLSFAGAARTEANWPLQLSGRYTNFHADSWINLVEGGKFKPIVTATGSFSLSGPLKNPGLLEMRTEAENLNINFSGLSWENERPVELSYADRVLMARPFRLRGASTDLQIEGSLRLAQPSALSITAEGHGDAALLRIFDPALQAVGSFDLNLRASGSPLQPSLNGAVTVRDLSVGYADLPFRLAGLNGEIRLEGDRVIIASLRGVSGQSSVNLTGFVTLSGTPSFDVRADLDHARVEYLTDFISVLTGNLRFVGTSESGRISGELVVGQMFVSEGFNILSWMTQLASPSLVQSSGIASPMASRIRLDVELVSDPEVRLDTPDLRLVANIGMRLQGTAAIPVGFGNIHIQSGEALIRGNRYTLARGDVNMTNPFRTRPLIDLEARTRVQRYDLTLNVNGPLNRPKITYRSDPPLPTEDVLSLLALGYTRQEQQMTAGASQPFGALGASALLSQALSSQVSGRVQRLFGVSRIKIDPNVGGPTTAGGTRVTVEQQITRDLTLTYVTNTAASQQRIIRLEWDISDNVSLIGDRDQNGVLGLELRFRRRFK